MKIYIKKQNENTLHPSQVLDIISDSEILISGPIKKSNFVFMHNDEIVDIIYYVENKGRYYFRGKIISRKFKSVYSLLIKKNSDIGIVQLREYYRLLSSFEVKKEKISRSDDSESVVEEICEAKDISGGGIKLYCNLDHQIGDEIFCSFKIQDSLLRVKGNVVRIEEIDSFNYKFSLGISFKDILEEERDLIIRYIFEQQRIYRNKGLI